MIDYKKHVCTYTEGAEMFGVTSHAIKIAVLRERIPARKSGGVNLVNIHDLVEYFGRNPEHIPPEIADIFPLESGE